MEGTVQTIVKSWRLLRHDRDAIEALARALRVSPSVAQVLLNRGITEPAAASQFLDAPLAGLLKPEILPGAREAAQRLHEAFLQGRRICVYGDYDADGITGIAILWRALLLIGAQAEFYVPNRLEEGYGLNADALRQLAGAGVSVVITVDCGIASRAEAEEARRLGLELIITDHHEPPAQLPEAAVIVHPRLPDGSYPFAGLSGAGVAFKVAWALCQLASGSDKVTPRLREYLLEAVVLAALGLVADVVPLQEENRVFVKHGLARLRHAPSPGMHALLQSAGITEKAAYNAEDISFKLAPRLNAVGRLGCARLVVELLTTSSAQRAADLARFLEGQNQQRQTIERRILSQARELAALQDSAPALVLASADWHPGVIGIVAGRLTEQLARPVLMIALGEPRPSSDSPGGQEILGQGSGRSVPGFPLHEALRECGDCLLTHGGHAAAAGFRIRAELIDEFREQFQACAARWFPDGLPRPQLLIDAEVPLATLTTGFLRDLDRLEPFGSGNRRPLFLAGDLQIVGEPALVGGGQRHVSFRVRQAGRTLRAIAFGMADRLEELMSCSGQCSLVFTPRLNDWQGFRRVDLDIVDFQAGPQARID